MVEKKGYLTDRCKDQEGIEKIESSSQNNNRFKQDRFKQDLKEVIWGGKSRGPRSGNRVPEASQGTGPEDVQLEPLPLLPEEWTGV